MVGTIVVPRAAKFLMSFSLPSTLCLNAVKGRAMGWGAITSGSIKDAELISKYAFGIHFEALELRENN
jgi:hypothetical protein